MELGEKIAELRKKEGLTQEQLSKKLFVSRTAVSKWESGRGYPSIDSLKALSKLFGVSIDSLLSGDELLKIATDEKSNLNSKKNFIIYGLLDFLCVLFIFLPIYGENDNGVVRSFAINGYIQYSFTGSIFLALLILLTGLGIAEILLQHFEKLKIAKVLFYLSLIIEIVTVLLFVNARQPYASTFMIILLLLKITFLFNNLRKKC